MQGYVSKDIAAYVGAAQPVSITFVVDTSASSLALNISVAFSGDAPTTSKVPSQPYHSSCWPLLLHSSTASHVGDRQEVKKPGSHAQVFAATQKAAEALATAIDSDPGSVFLTLVQHKVHGKALNIEILGPSSAASAGGVL